MTVAAAKSSAQGGLILDLVERAFMLVLGLRAIVRLAPAVMATPGIALILISEGLGVAFILVRRRSALVDQTPYGTAIGFLGTAAPLLVIAPGRPLIPMAAGVAMMVTGLLLSISAKLALNRSFGIAAANRGVKLAGPYRLVRHPMYAGYLVTQIGFLLVNPCLWNAAVYAVAWSMQVLRIRAEEDVLLQDAAYGAYARETRFRLLPGIF
jgi:protein-S-isoprenylcysteine O-methyltransferase Ste14